MKTDLPMTDLIAFLVPRRIDELTAELLQLDTQREKLLEERAVLQGVLEVSRTTNYRSRTTTEPRVEPGIFGVKGPVAP